VEKNCNCNDICVLGFARGQRNELCCKMAYRYCECKCADVTLSKETVSLKRFQMVQLIKRIFHSLSISNRKYDDLQPLSKMKLSHNVFEVLERTEI